MKNLLLPVLCLLVFTQVARSQQYSIVIKEGHVIDPKNNIDAIMDVAIADGKIAAVAKSIDTKQAIQVVNAKGLYVVPVSSIFIPIISSGRRRITT